MTKKVKSENPFWGEMDKTPTSYDYQVGVYMNKDGRKNSTHSFRRDTKTCGNEVLETANKYFTGDNTCRIDNILVRNKLGQVFGYVGQDGEIIIPKEVA